MPRLLTVAMIVSFLSIRLIHTLFARQQRIPLRQIKITETP